MYKKLIQFFGKLGTRLFGHQLEPLRELTEKSNLPLVYETYVGQLFFYCSVTLVALFIYFTFLLQEFWRIELLSAVVGSAIFSLAVTSLIATIFCLYPFFKYQSQKDDIERKMVFGISYMSIISKSGVPIQKTILYTSKEKDFGEFSKEFERVHKYASFLGKDMISSLKEVSNRTPSQKFKSFIDGLAATIVSGSDINKYLSQEAKKEIQNYRERGNKYTSLMSIFADIYIVGLLIAPLCTITILAIFSLMESSFLGISLKSLIAYMVYIFLPIAGLIYLAGLSRFKI